MERNYKGHGCGRDKKLGEQTWLVLLWPPSWTLISFSPSPALSPPLWTLCPCGVYLTWCLVLPLWWVWTCLTNFKPMSGINHFFQRGRKDITFIFHMKRLESGEASSSGKGHTAGLCGGPAPFFTQLLGDRCVPLPASAKWPIYLWSSLHPQN